MKLNFVERFGLLAMLPQQSSFILMQRVIELRAKLVPTDAEVKTCGIETLDTGGIRWKDASYSVDIEIGDMLAEEIKRVLKEKDSQKQISTELVELYKKFVDGDDKR